MVFLFPGLKEEKNAHVPQGVGVNKNYAPNYWNRLVREQVSDQDKDQKIMKEMAAWKDGKENRLVENIVDGNIQGEAVSRFSTLLGDYRIYRDLFEEYISYLLDKQTNLHTEMRPRGFNSLFRQAEGSDQYDEIPDGDNFQEIVAKLICKSLRRYPKLANYLLKTWWPEKDVPIPGWGSGGKWAQKVWQAMKEAYSNDPDTLLNALRSGAPPDLFNIMNRLCNQPGLLWQTSVDDWKWLATVLVKASEIDITSAAARIAILIEEVEKNGNTDTEKTWVTRLFENEDPELKEGGERLLDKGLQLLKNRSANETKRLKMLGFASSTQPTSYPD
ncbi:hypothetical protein SAMN02745216_03145 [Desulfatibacillum alkenivorans DSM 16219]|uniref:Uncharacterized protein n=1 Tax=Desulfatibacillum alkenivorans DSM 16219 TaxID=1121393 RepID=A0A1M6QYP9_9BACT|nr:hypothetical protein [Desulfatibacillum alkenivorans]SHK25389.1 hypothetical protein SAMN02745216_03145 [Desulfatibacillum alkenivorans DSM 16219]